MFVYFPLKMYYVYIIQAEADDNYYVGYTKNITERLKRHNQGRSTYTKSKKNWKLTYTKRYKTSSEALAKEKQVKGKKSKKYVKYLVRPSLAKGGGRSFRMNSESLVDSAYVICCITRG